MSYVGKADAQADAEAYVHTVQGLTHGEAQADAEAQTDAESLR